MDILIIGSGGREHAFAIGFNESESVNNIHVAPGNVGTSKIAINHDIDISKPELILELASKLGVDTRSITSAGIPSRMIKIALGVAPATASAGNMPAAPTNTRAAYAAALVTRRAKILLKK